jgi:hypothetical protein
MLAEAKVLREQAEELCRSRQSNVQALEQQMVELRRRCKAELLKMETRNRVSSMWMVRLQGSGIKD